MNLKLISGVRVDLDNEQVKACDSIYDIRKLDLFNHLSEEERDSAETELLTDLNKNEDE